MTLNRNYSNTSTEAALVGSITAANTSFTLSSFGGFPAAPFTAVIDRGTALEEIVLVTSVSVSTVICTRGYDNTTAKSHDAGAQFLHVVTAVDYEEANTHIVSASGVHGLTGSVVGTSDTQTLTNKTLTAPTIAGPTITGTSTMGTATFSGTIAVTGNASFSTVSTTGNVNIGGTLGVIGAASLSSASLTGSLTVSGAATLNGAVTVPTPSLSGQAANKGYADALGTDLNTPSTIMRRDGSGVTAVGTITVANAPTGTNHATRKDYVDAQVAALRGAFAMGAVLIDTTKIAPDSALHATITVAAVATPTRITFWAQGRSGFDSAAQEMAWEFDTIPGSATNIVENYDATQVHAASGDFTTVLTSITYDLPASVAATARPVLRSTGDVYNRGAVTWVRVPI